jgi:hypothetical protein
LDATDSFEDAATRQNAEQQLAHAAEVNFVGHIKLYHSRPF